MNDANEDTENKPAESILLDLVHVQEHVDRYTAYDDVDEIYLLHQSE